MKNAILFAIFAFTAFGQAHGQNVDEEQSKVTFEISNLGFNTVEGTFTGMKGLVKLDPANLAGSVINVCIDAATVNTGTKKRDEHLRTDDFFDVEKYSTICFASTGISKKEDGFEAMGNLTMHGVTKEVTIPLTLTGNTINGKLMVSRKDYNVGEDISKFTAGYEVEIQIVTVLKK